MTTVDTQPAYLFGIDIVPLARVEGMLARYGDTLTTRLAADDERAGPAATPAAHHVAALIAIKEATIKAVGGRPPGFGWHGINVTPSLAAPPADIAALFDEFWREVGWTLPVAGGAHPIAVRVTPTMAALVASRLPDELVPPAAEARVPDVAGLGQWGVRAGDVLAVVAMWRGDGR